jgi:thiamine kinase-like enzyme
MSKKIIGMEDNEIISSIYGKKAKSENIKIQREKSVKNRRFILIPITISSPEGELKIIEKIFSNNDQELYRFGLIKQYSSIIPKIYQIDVEKRILLIEDLNTSYFQGFHFNEDNEYGKIFKKNHSTILSAIAKFHSVFWDNYDVFGKVGLDKRLESKENLTAYIGNMEKDFKKYQKNEKDGKIPKTWNSLENKIDLKKLDYFQNAIEILHQEYFKIVDTRFHAGKNITVIHGDLHPGNIFMSKSKNRDIKIIDLEALRMGLCTEDLAMLMALHIEPNIKKAKPLLEHYHQCLCENVKGYSYDVFMNDYKISVIENMFFPIRLINQGIFAFNMRDNAIKAFETMIL